MLAHAQSNNYLATVTLKQGKVYAFFVKSPAKVRSMFACADTHTECHNWCSFVQWALLPPCRSSRATSPC